MNENSSASGTPQIHSLTGLRGIAAWLVVLYHIRLSLLDILPANAISILAKGYLAVDLFFMLSGFVMWLNYGAKFRAGGLRVAPFFWWKRLARIWPLHAAILIAMIAFAILLAATGRASDGYPFAQLPLHFALIQNWGLTTDLTWNHPAWSISTELAAYLLFPFLVCLGRWERAGLGVLLAILGGLALAVYLCFAMQGLDGLGAAIPRTGLWRCLGEFAIGTVLAIIWQRYRGRAISAPIALMTALAIFAVAIIAQLPETAFVPLAFAAVLSALAFDNGPIARFFESAPLRWLGDVSYSTYLGHYFLFILFKLLFVDDSLQLGWALLTAYLILVGGASAALFYWVEKPCQRRLRNRYDRIDTRASYPTIR